ncbi:MAG: hypothetical protein GF308_03030 [Candidatus Heimdallarchaeota archaeon]|nr:hypothetical protein [Candidatus Heimdallarchaeota archaeon]
MVSVHSDQCTSIVVEITIQIRINYITGTIHLNFDGVTSFGADFEPVIVIHFAIQVSILRCRNIPTIE